jgi:hypothetical protein
LESVRLLDGFEQLVSVLDMCIDARDFRVEHPG